VVIRRGGIVSLKPVVEALERVEAGTDRTASELAMARLEKEIYFLRQEMRKEDPGTSVIDAVGCFFGLAAAFLLGSALVTWLLSLYSGVESAAAVLCLAVPGIIAGAIAWRLGGKRPGKAWSARQQRLKAQLDAKIAEYEEHRRIVEGNR